MKVRQSFAVAHPPETVWQALSDVRLVADCMPGAELDEAAADGTLNGRLKVKLGPISTAFQGQARLERDDAARAGSLEGSGIDGRSNSRAKAKLAYRVVAEGSGSRVEIDSDIALAGALAQFGRGEIVNDIAQQLTRSFAANLEARLGPAATAESEAATPPPPPDREIAGGRLLLGVLWRRLLAGLRRLFGRA